SANKEYSLKKEYYNQIKEFGENYMDAILNVDYTKIDKNIFKENLNLYLGNKLEDDVLNKYIEYVKSNKIIIKGKAKAQMPCIYYDGIFYRLRMNIEYKIISANKKENILLFDFDEDTKIQYEKLTNSMYIDLPYTVSPFLDIVYVDNQCINQLIVSGDNL
ncbi:MAG: hypothetical protein RSF67_02385, partial [Clostridia bacterium]